MIAICERTSIEITLENATNYAVYALLRLFSIIDGKIQYIQVHLKSYFTTQYFKSFFTFLYINGLCFTIHVI